MSRAHCRLAVAAALGHGEGKDTVFKDEYGMKRIMAAGALASALALAACGDSKPAAPAENPADAAIPAAAADAATPAADAAPATSTPLVAPSRPAPAAPSFAQMYPGATVTDPAITALGPDGKPGGAVSFTTPASPDTVVAFYRQRAEAAGLVATNSLNRGSARAFGAASADGGGSLLNVVADAVPDGQTHVQLMWTEGK